MVGGGAVGVGRCAVVDVVGVVIIVVVCSMLFCVDGCGKQHQLQQGDCYRSKNTSSNKRNNNSKKKNSSNSNKTTTTTTTTTTAAAAAATATAATIYNNSNKSNYSN